MADCRFAPDCPDEAVYRVAMDRGCVCYPNDRLQLLCAHHAHESEPLGTWHSQPIGEATDDVPNQPGGNGAV